MSTVLRGKKVIKGPDPEAPAQELFSQRRKPEIGQFRLQVDRQTKASFSTYETAEEAGKEIKEGHLWFGWRCTMPSSAQIRLSSYRRRNLA